MEPILRLALLTPFNLKECIIFSSTKLLFIKHAEIGVDKTIKIPDNSRINISVLKKWCDSNIFAHQNLLKNIAEFDSADPGTFSFRHKEVHRIAPHLMWGQKIEVNVIKNDVGYAQDVGIYRPLLMKDAFLPNDIRGFLERVFRE